MKRWADGSKTHGTHGTILGKGHLCKISQNLRVLGPDNIFFRNQVVTINWHLGICLTIESSGQQKSPSLLHTAGTPQSHLSFGVNSNMTVTSGTLILLIDMGGRHFVKHVTGGEWTERPRAVPPLRCEPGLRGSQRSPSAKGNLFLSSQFANVWPTTKPTKPMVCLPTNRAGHTEDSSSAEAPGHMIIIAIINTSHNWSLTMVLSRLARVGAIESCQPFQNNPHPSNCKLGARSDFF